MSNIEYRISNVEVGARDTSTFSPSTFDICFSFLRHSIFLCSIFDILSFLPIHPLSGVFAASSYTVCPYCFHWSSSVRPLFLYCSYTKSEDPKRKQCGPKEKPKRDKSISKVETLITDFKDSGHNGRFGKGQLSLFQCFSYSASRLLRVFFGSCSEKWSFSRSGLEEDPKKTRRKYPFWGMAKKYNLTLSCI
jgi:hypothetical protein